MSPRSKKWCRVYCGFFITNTSCNSNTQMVILIAILAAGSLYSCNRKWSKKCMKLNHRVMWQKVPKALLSCCGWCSVFNERTTRHVVRVPAALVELPLNHCGNQNMTLPFHLCIVSCWWSLVKLPDVVGVLTCSGKTWPSDGPQPVTCLNRQHYANQQRLARRGSLPIYNGVFVDLQLKTYDSHHH